MNRLRYFSVTTVWTICISFFLTSWLLAEGGGPLVTQTIAENEFRQIDVALGTSGTLSGVITDANGTTKAHQIVYLVRQDVALASTVSDAQGHFQFNGISGGVYSIQSGSYFGTYRLWSADTAPPVAVSFVQLNVGQTQRQVVGNGTSDGNSGPVVRGAGPGFIGGLHLPSIHPGQWVKHPWVVGAAIGTAVAVPIALHNDEPPAS